MARIAKSLGVLRDQVNTAWPRRSKSSDGWIGDTAHSKRKSDHNPNSAGVVCALDITNDPARGCSAQSIVNAIVQSKDNRVSYLIWNRRICASYKINNVDAWVWRPYNGSNPHNKHCHISVRQKASVYDDQRKWRIKETKVAESAAIASVSASTGATAAASQSGFDMTGFTILAFILILVSVGLVSGIFIYRKIKKAKELEALKHPIGPKELGIEDAHITDHSEE